MKVSSKRTTPLVDTSEAVLVKATAALSAPAIVSDGDVHGPPVVGMPNTSPKLNVPIELTEVSAGNWQPLGIWKDAVEDGWKLVELLTAMEMMKDFMYMIDASGFTVTESVPGMTAAPLVVDTMLLPCASMSAAKSVTSPVAGSAVKFSGRMKAAVHDTVTTGPWATCLLETAGARASQSTVESPGMPDHTRVWPTTAAGGGSVNEGGGGEEGRGEGRV